MKIVTKWIFWLARAWPMWTLLAIGFVIGRYASWSIPAGAPVFNKVAGAALQVVGALIILLSLDQNLGLFRNQNLFSVAWNWCQDYPRQNSAINLIGAAMGNANASGSMASIRTLPFDLNGRMAELERVVGLLEGKISRIRIDLSTEIAKAHQEGKGELDIHRRVVSDLIVKLEMTAIGGIKFQAFGVGLAFLGSVLSVYS
jgi:hypothetical protein